MSTIAAETGHSPSRFVAAELRAAIARVGVSQREVSRRLHVQQAWLSRRLSPLATGEVDLTFEEVELICRGIGVDPDAVILNALRARRDSNPKPSDLESRHLTLVPTGRVTPGGISRRVGALGSEVVRPVGRLTGASARVIPFPQLGAKAGLTPESRLGIAR